MKTLLGYVLLFLIFSGLFLASVKMEGIKHASMIWGASLLLAALILISILLICSK